MNFVEGEVSEEQLRAIAEQAFGDAQTEKLVIQMLLADSDERVLAAHIRYGELKQEGERALERLGWPYVTRSRNRAELEEAAREVRRTS